MQTLVIGRARVVALACAAIAASLALAVGAHTALAAALPSMSKPTTKTATKSPHPITEHASRVTADSAMLHGVIATHGVKTDWQFQFGRSTAYGRATPVKAIPAGKGTVPVSWMIRHLMPGVTYHFRLVAIVSTSKGVHRIDGRDEMFTTRTAGRVLLAHTLLHVVSGHIDVALRCDSTTACSGHMRIDARARVKGHFASVLCAAGSFSLGAHAKASLSVRARRACVTLLRSARHHRLVAKLHLHTATGQPALTRRVILVLM
jgi:hypothetical protein